MSASEKWEPVIGLEVHAQLKTRSKLFSACPVAGGSTADLSPNTFTDEVVLALPGTLPVPNAQAIRLAVRLGLALGCRVDQRSQFSRKHYFYPDLPKGYQVSQYEDPICAGGAVPVTILGAQTNFALRRIHLEEDAGKTIHDARRGESRVDLNRAGVALVEIVSEPVLASSEEAVAYLKALHRLVVWLEVSDGDMEAGNFRCDANVSVRRPGAALGTRTEIKNVNSFKFVGAAIDAEIARQIGVLTRGGEVVQETRGWDEASGQTRSLRSKEDAHDYRYFPDPDLLVLDVPESVIEEEKRFVASRRIEDAENELRKASAPDQGVAFFTSSYDHYKLAPIRDGATAMGLASEFYPRFFNETHATPASVMPMAGSFGPIARALDAGEINRASARQLVVTVFATGANVQDLIAAEPKQVSDAGALVAAIEPILDASPAQIAEFLAGKEKVFGFFVGQAMRALKGKAHPEELQRVLRERLEARRT